MFEQAVIEPLGERFELAIPAKPHALPLDPDGIPKGLKDRPQWVVWRYEFDPAKSKPWTKVPYSARNSRRASHSAPGSWSDFQTALNLYKKGEWAGIGYVFSKEDPFCGVDLDDCRIPGNGAIDQDKRIYVERLASYTEISPSGAGLHVIIQGSLSGGGRKNSKSGIEVYDRERFFCFTGRRLEGTPAEINERQSELDWFLAKVFDEQPRLAVRRPQATLSADEKRLLQKAFANPKTGQKVTLLYAGHFKEAGFESRSEADQSLCNHLAFWFNRDPVAIDKAFRSSGLMRPKWDQKHYSNGDTYGERTIQKAIDATGGGYEEHAIPPQAASDCSEIEWGDPYDLFGEPLLTGKPEWPENACPKAIEAFARDEAERLGVDIAMVAIPAIGVAATAVSDAFKIQPKGKDDTWKEDPRLWVAIIAEPGQKKSPALKSAKRPLEKIGYELHLAQKEAMTQYERDLAAWRAAGEAGELPRKPVEQRLYVDDITIEALRRVLEENPRGVGILKDELSGWLTSFDIYRSSGGKGGSKDRADFCELYQGDPKPFDRAEKGLVYVPHWGASIVGGIQPGPVRRLMGQITDDGLVARFLVAHCERLGKGSEREPDKVAIITYHNVIRALVLLKPRSEVETFIFSRPAHRYRMAVRDIAESVQLLPDTCDALKAHLNKWEGAFCRLALVYHLIESVAAGEYPCREVSEQTAKMAATLMTDFLLGNSIRFYAETIDGGAHSALARWVAGYILSAELEAIARRDLMRINRQFSKNPKAITATMNALYAANWVEEAHTKRSGEVTSWAVNPKVHIKFQKLAAAERERRAEERKKIEQVVEVFRKSRISQ